MSSARGRRWNCVWVGECLSDAIYSLSLLDSVLRNAPSVLDNAAVAAALLACFLFKQGVTPSP